MNRARHADHAAGKYERFVYFIVKVTRLHVRWEEEKVRGEGGG